ncbi:MAG: ATP-binding protein [Pseudomonadota bacterium]
MENGFFQRLLDARWALLAAFAVLAYAVFDGRLDAAYAIGAAAVIFFVTALAPRRASHRSVARTSARGRSVWPDTGMKVAVDAFPLPCVVVDHKAIIRHANSAANELAGVLQPGDPLAYRMRSPDVLAALDRVAAGGPEEAVEWREKVPSERVLEARFSPVRLPGSQRRHPIRPDFVVIAFFDLTELYRLDRMRADFVANASHELRTPLASLTGFIETLQGPARQDPEAWDHFLSIMLEQSNRMGRLINDLLSLSRIEMKGHVRPDREAELRSVVDHVVDALSPLAREMSVRIETRFDQARLVVRGDNDELIQVFENLIENAIRYGVSGQEVEITDGFEAGSGEAPGYFTISVRDFGPGIAPEHLPRLTERFYRVDDDTSRINKGTGLGLAIVKHIVNRHSGRLSIVSDPGQGAVFTVSLPAVVDPRFPQARAEKAI